MDRTITLNITRQQAPQFSGLLSVKYALDPRVVQIAQPENANFSHLMGYHPQSRDWSDVSNCVLLGPLWENYILTINPKEARPKLINNDGSDVRVFWYKNGGLVYGDMIPGSTLNYKNKVRVKCGTDGKPIITRLDVSRGGVLVRDFVQLDGFRRADMGRPVADLIAEGRMGYFTEIANWKVYRALGGYPDLLCPYWGDDFTRNQGAVYFPLDYFEA